MDRHDERLHQAIAEIRGAIREQWPAAAFEVFTGEDSEGVYLRATVEEDDPGVVNDAVRDRLLDLQIDEGLPIYVVAVRPIARVLEERRHRTGGRPMARAHAGVGV